MCAHVVRAYAVGCTHSTSYIGFPCACVLDHRRVQAYLIRTYFDKDCAYPAVPLALPPSGLPRGAGVLRYAQGFPTRPCRVQV
jgi:hypothetical protein